MRDLRLGRISFKQLLPVGKPLLVVLREDLPHGSLIGSCRNRRILRNTLSCEFLFEVCEEITEVQLVAPAVHDNVVAGDHKIALVITLSGAGDMEQRLLLQVEGTCKKLLTDHLDPLNRILLFTDIHIVKAKAAVRDRLP